MMDIVAQYFVMIVLFFCHCKGACLLDQMESSLYLVRSKRVQLCAGVQNLGLVPILAEQTIYVYITVYLIYRGFPMKYWWVLVINNQLK